jgi:subtilisin family serine protease
VPGFGAQSKSLGARRKATVYLPGLERTDGRALNRACRVGVGASRHESERAHRSHCRRPRRGRRVGALAGPAPPAGPPKLAPGVKDFLATHRRSAPPKAPVGVMIAAVPGRQAAVAERVGELGGKVLHRADDVGYLRARVPVEAVEALAGFSGVEALDLWERARAVAPDWRMDCAYFGPVSAKAPPKDGRPARPDVAPPGKETPAANPYLPTRDVGAPQFVAAHPTYDGRGVTVAVLETVPNLFAPELNEPALTLDGRPTRKIASIHAGPREGGVPQRYSMPTPMDTRVTVKGGRFEVGKVSYAAPRQAGEFRFGQFDAMSERMMCKLFKTPAAMPGKSDLYAVLWDERSGEVWVDTNQDRDFSNEKPLRDYNAHHEVGAWANGLPADQRLGYAVSTDGKAHAVQVHVGCGAHTTSVASVLAGKGFFGGKMSGVAPAARLALFPVHGNAFNILETVIRAARTPQVDVICYARPMGGYGWGVYDRVLDRVIERYRKPVINAAGNAGPHLATVTGGTSRGVILAGGNIHRDTYAALFGTAGGREDYLHFFASRGPLPDGLLKPDVVAPLVSLAATSPLDFRPGVERRVAGGPDLPRRYAVVRGTSFASPMVAGSVALLVSAAKQEKVPCDAERLRWALTASARFLDGYGVHEQGAGLVNVPRAWELLKKAPEPVRITCRCPVRAVLPPWAGPVTEGRGLFEREGWSAGQKGTRALVFRRSSGPDEGVRYHLTWAGNDGTFATAAAVTLPRDKDVPLPVDVAPRTQAFTARSYAFRPSRAAPPCIKSRRRSWPLTTSRRRRAAGWW